MKLPWPQAGHRLRQGTTPGRCHPPILLPRPSRLTDPCFPPSTCPPTPLPLAPKAPSRRCRCSSPSAEHRDERAHLQHAAPQRPHVRLPPVLLLRPRQAQTARGASDSSGVREAICRESWFVCVLACHCCCVTPKYRSSPISSPVKNMFSVSVSTPVSLSAPSPNHIVSLVRHIVKELVPSATPQVPCKHPPPPRAVCQTRLRPGPARRSRPASPSPSPQPEIHRQVHEHTWCGCCSIFLY